MKKLISFTLSLLFLFLLQGQAQNHSKVSFERGTYHTAFDYVYFDYIVKEGDKEYLYFNTERRGIINNHSDEGYVDFKGILQVVLDGQGQIESTKHRFFEHEYAYNTKKLVYFTSPYQAGVLSHEPLASGKEIIPEEVAVVKAEFPNYFNGREESLDAGAKEKLPVYYENKMKYSGMRKGLTSFLQGTYTLRKEDNRGKVAKFIVEEASDYEYNRKIIDINSYRDSDKETAWFASTPSVCDEVTGNVYNMNRKIIKKGKFKNYQTYEYVTFDKDGKLLNRVDKKFSIPAILENSHTIYQKNEDGFSEVDKRIYIMKDCDLLGVGVKKEFGDRIKENRRHLLQVNADGTEDKYFTVMPENITDYFTAYQSGAGQTVVVGYAKNGGLEFLTLTDTEKPQSYVFSPEDDLLQSLKSEKEAKGYTWTIVSNKVLADGNRSVVFRLSDRVIIPSGQVGVPGTKENHFVGWMCVITDNAGKPLSAHRIRREGDAMTKKGQLFYVGETDTAFKYMIKDPMTYGRMVSVVNIRKSDFNMSRENLGRFTNANYKVEDNKLYIIGEKSFDSHTVRLHPESTMIYHVMTVDL